MVLMTVSSTFVLAFAIVIPSISTSGRARRRFGGSKFGGRRPLRRRPTTHLRQTRSFRMSCSLCKLVLVAALLIPVRDHNQLRHTVYYLMGICAERLAASMLR
jgi:hypothetical protein